jgi:hypothetical protein
VFLFSGQENRKSGDDLLHTWAQKSDPKSLAQKKETPVQLGGSPGLNPAPRTVDNSLMHEQLKKPLIEENRKSGDDLLHTWAQKSEPKVLA